MISKKLLTRSNLVYVVAVSWALFQLYALIFLIDILLLRIVHVTFALILAYLIKPLRKPFDKIIDPILIVLAIITCSYYASIIDLIAERIPYVTPLTTYDLIFGSLLIALTVEAVRRTAGKILALFITVFILYWLFGPLLPGIIHHDLSPRLIFEQISLSTAGILGFLTYISSTFVYLFILFSALLYGTGIGRFYIDLALASVGRTRGGGAKAAIIASSLFGTISGASVSNVLATGTFTIPLMKKLGYKPALAGAVEAIASTGGQLMPPIMGAAAFIIAEVLGVDYLYVCFAAAVPAILYYIALFVTVDLIAQKDGLAGVKLGSFGWRSIVKSSYLLIPLIVLIYRLVAIKAPLRAILDSIMVTIALIVIKTLIIERKPRNLKLIFDSLRDGSVNATTVACILAGIGIVVGVITMTGLGLKITSGIIYASQGNIALILILTMATCLLLGMGMPTTAAYILTASIAAPLLIGLGFSKLAVHLFIFYFAILSAITPPVAVAAYAASALAGSNIYETGLLAFKLGLAAYIIPYIFLTYNDLIHPSIQTIVYFTLTLLALTSLSIAVTGYLKGKLSVPWRIAFVALTPIILMPQPMLSIAGTIIFAVLVVSRMFKFK
ncbi:MAG: hypothetical protein DRO23_02730 [Thermoprotei archaeon]|nr:MAG: hypothetical protein DRO23_02730 [Thermoprotei archaeon]